MLTLLRHRRKAFRETYLSEDNFEESGTPASWAVIGGSVDFDATPPSPSFNGGETLHTADRYNNCDRTGANQYAYFQFFVDSLGAGSTNIFTIKTSDSSYRAIVNLRDSGVVRLLNPSGYVDVTNSYSANRWYHVWLHYNPSTGFMSLEFNTTGTRTGTGDNYVSTTIGGTSTATFTKVEINGRRSANMYIDRVLISDAVIGSQSNGTSYRSTVLADNPLFYYRLGEASGTDAYDEVAAGNNGTYYNTPDLGETGAVSGDSNTSVKFKEASSEYATTVTLTETSLLPCTIECFVKLDGASDGNAGIVFYRATNAQASGLNLYGSSTKLGYHWNGSSATYGFSSGPTLADNTWYYVALVVEATQATIYTIEENGTLATPAVNTTTHTALDASGDHWLIGLDDATTRYFQGTIDEVAIYDQALSQSTLVAHAAAAGFTS